MATPLELDSSEYQTLTEHSIDLFIALGAMQEGAWTGSMGGHDPDALKLKGNLLNWWREKVKSDPHPFAYCVRHLEKKFGANVNRICAWLKDQAEGSTDWRKKKGMKESALDNYVPTLSELRMAVEALSDAYSEGASATTPVQEAATSPQREVESVVFEGSKKLITYTDGTTEGGL